jgi:hypothetical protein
MARTACLVCFIRTVNGHCNKKRKEKKKLPPWKAGASSRHTTNLKQSILRLSISMVPLDWGITLQSRNGEEVVSRVLNECGLRYGDAYPDADR